MSPRVILGGPPRTVLLRSRGFPHPAFSQGRTNALGTLLAWLWALAVPGASATNGATWWTARDLGFRPQFDGQLQAMAFEPGGRVVVAGTFRTVNTTPRAYLARVNADGSLDASFVPPVLSGQGVPSQILVARQSDGHLIVAGYTYPLVGPVAPFFVRLGSDGAKDPAFKGDPTNAVGLTRLLVSRDDRLLLAGGDPSPLLMLRADGTPDPEFKPAAIDPPGALRSVVTDSMGRFLVSGGFTSIGGAPVSSLARLTAAGALDPTFQPAVDGAEDLVAMSDDGVVVSRRSPLGITAELSLIRLDALGHPVPQFLVSTQVVNAWKGFAAHLLARIDDDCIVVGESDCSIGGCYDSAGLMDGAGQILVAPNAKTVFAISVPIGSTGSSIGAIRAVSTNLWYAAVANRLMRFVVLRAGATGVSFAQPSSWAPQGPPLRVMVLRGGDTNVAMTVHYRIATADGSTDYGPVNGAVTLAAGDLAVPLTAASPGRLGNAPERLLTVNLESVEGGTLYGLTRTTVHVVNDYEAARAPYLRVSRFSSPFDSGVSLELRHFEVGFYSLQVSPDLRNFSSYYGVEVDSSDPAPTVNLGFESTEGVGGRFFRVVAEP